MSRSRYAEIECDTCEDYIVTEPTMRKAIAAAKRDGWELAPAEKGGDLCPDCIRIREKTIEEIAR